MINYGKVMSREHSDKNTNRFHKLIVTNCYVMLIVCVAE
jgi:hypothetical protein